MSHGEWFERAEIHALGALDGEELTQFQAHLAAGCHPCEAHLREAREALTLLPRSLALLGPPPGVKTRVLEQVERQTTPAEGHRLVDEPGLTFVRSSEGEWQEIAPGVFLKALYVDPLAQRSTALVRMGAGSRYGAHRHAETEELYVLEGSCFCGGQLLSESDYHRAEAGTIHVETWTENGCLMLVMTSQRNEMLR